MRPNSETQRSPSYSNWRTWASIKFLAKAVRIRGDLSILHRNPWESVDTTAEKIDTSAESVIDPPHQGVHSLWFTASDVFSTDSRPIPTNSAGLSMDAPRFPKITQGASWIAIDCTRSVSVIAYAAVTTIDCSRSKTDSAGLWNSASAAWCAMVIRTRHVPNPNSGSSCDTRFYSIELGLNFMFKDQVEIELELEYSKSSLLRAFYFTENCVFSCSLSRFERNFFHSLSQRRFVSSKSAFDGL